GGLWGTVEAAADTARTAATADPSARENLNRATLDFIREGAPPGEREKRLFQAAANLGEFGADERLATALLLPAALDCGLAPGEARRAVACGLARGKGAA
ncbi:MAG TPA: DNA primase, partial [Candidatus Hydrogenedentes bacterium]|nr:DNA primase [Candidatus Hydrogenedentota bacterium]